MRSPYDTGANELGVAKFVFVVVGDFCLHQDGLGGIVHLGRNEADAATCDEFSGAVHNLHRHIHFKLRSPLDRNVNINFQRARLVHSGQDGGIGDSISDANRNVAHNTRSRRRYPIVVQLDLLLTDLRLQGPQLSFRCVQCGARLIQLLFAHHSCSSQ